MRQKVHVIASFTVKQESLVGFLEKANTLLVEPGRADTGCIQYELCQSSEDPCQCAMIEQWRSMDDLNAHLQSDYIPRALDTLRSMVSDGPHVTRYYAT